MDGKVSRSNGRHHRTEELSTWLTLTGEVHSLPFDLLRPYPEEDLESWLVRDKVGHTRNNWAALIEQISEDSPKVEKRPKRKKPKRQQPGLFD